MARRRPSFPANYVTSQEGDPANRWFSVRERRARRSIGTSADNHHKQRPLIPSWTLHVDDTAPVIMAKALTSGRQSIDIRTTE
jgi:hypothetical protein